MCSALRHLPISMEVRYDLPDSATVCSPLSGVPGIRYLPVAGPPMTTGLKPIYRMRVDAISIACGWSPLGRTYPVSDHGFVDVKAKALGVLNLR